MTYFGFPFANKELRRRWNQWKHQKICTFTFYPVESSLVRIFNFTDMCFGTKQGITRIWDWDDKIDFSPVDWSTSELECFLIKSILRDDQLHVLSMKLIMVNIIQSMRRILLSIDWLGSNDASPSSCLLAQKIE